ncbi:hypothetical protein [Gloeobacter violaceus]|uniref:hypothetical protein n=1 Tax=Gloeobacter violaceus TaxID=33072 RepID=UPI0013E8CA20|nr:hypothetical protein [Gloeobacter violaceus]
METAQGTVRLPMLKLVDDLLDRGTALAQARTGRPQPLPRAWRVASSGIQGPLPAGCPLMAVSNRV